MNELIEAASAAYVSAANLLENRIVPFDRSDENAILALVAFLLNSCMIAVEVTPRVVDVAFDAYLGMAGAPAVMRP